MRKTITIILILVSLNSFSQKNNTQDSVKKVQADAAKFIDSLTKHTTIAEFQAWLYDNVTAKNFNEGKFTDLYNFFLQSEYTKWMQKPKKK